MVRNSWVDKFDDVSRPIIAIGNLYPHGYTIPAHHHRRGQLLYGASGSLMVETAFGTWVVPPQRGMWIPSGITHEVRMLGDVTRAACIWSRMRQLGCRIDARW